MKKAEGNKRFRQVHLPLEAGRDFVKKLQMVAHSRIQRICWGIGQVAELDSWRRDPFNHYPGREQKSDIYGKAVVSLEPRSDRT